jgi:ketosteroid isomerase-like protein
MVVADRPGNYEKFSVMFQVSSQRGWLMLKNLFLVAVLIVASVHQGVVAAAPPDPRAEVAAALKGMGDAANSHDVERHVGYYAHIPNVTLIADGEPFIGWDTIRDKQSEWWNNGKTDVVYQIRGAPEVLELAPNVVVTTLLLTAHRTLPNGEVKEGRFAVSSIWQKQPEGWKVVY